eukprot:1013143-Amphidinium_carterae.1
METEPATLAAIKKNYPRQNQGFITFAWTGGPVHNRNAVLCNSPCPLEKTGSASIARRGERLSRNPKVGSSGPARVSEAGSSALRTQGPQRAQG